MPRELQLSDVTSLPITEDDNDTFADLERVRAFEELPADSQEAIVAYELNQLDRLLTYTYDLQSYE